ncbi:tyrosine-type recombinase/integrase [Desulfonatronum thiodismutans]|uniref:tyrosine-type recombinase/integrase n=1 Tax=Desulfonatronum thiodismutans TaxID=159290 RepID=UPI0004ABE2C0|nr:integrase family protein [Desulfonatronum thiodismutans]
MSQKDNIVRFTKSKIDSLPIPEKGDAVFWDSEAKGFGLRVWSSGKKVFIYKTRIKGRQVKMNIGTYGAMTLDAARKALTKLAGEIAIGRDPVADRHEEKVTGVTLGQAVERYLEDRDLKPRTVRDVLDCMKRFSEWEGKPISAITRDIVARKHKELGKISHARANLAMRYLKAILNHASEAFAYPDGRPLLPDNPVKILSVGKAWFHVGRKRTYLRHHELKPWIAAILSLGEAPEREPGTGNQHRKLKAGDDLADLFMTLLLTGLRRNEALGLKWADVDLKWQALTIPDPKNRQPHTLPLGKHLFSILARRKKMSDTDLVFEGLDNCIRYGLARVEKETGIRVTPHDLRRTFSTIAESLDIPAYALKALLNHKTSGDVTAGYIQMTPDRLRAPMQKIEDFILAEAGLTDQGDNGTSKVLDFPGKIAVVAA